MIEMNNRIPVEIQEQFTSESYPGGFTDEENNEWKFKANDDGLLLMECEELMAQELVFIEKPDPVMVEATEHDITHVSVKRKDGSYSSLTSGIIATDGTIEIFGIDDPEELFEMINETMLAFANLLQNNIQ